MPVCSKIQSLRSQRRPLCARTQQNPAPAVTEASPLCPYVAKISPRGHRGVPSVPVRNSVPAVTEASSLCPYASESSPRGHRGVPSVPVRNKIQLPRSQRRPLCAHTQQNSEPTVTEASSLCPNAAKFSPRGNRGVLSVTMRIEIQSPRPHSRPMSASHRNTPIPHFT